MIPGRSGQLIPMGSNPDGGLGLNLGLCLYLGAVGAGQANENDTTL